MNCSPLIGLALVLSGFAGAAQAAAPGEEKASAATPRNWNYEIRNGQRVPKASRQTNSDGSWREESKVGNCVTIRERTAEGEYREVRSCE